MELELSFINSMKKYYNEKYHTYVFKKNKLVEQHLHNINIDEYLKQNYTIMYVNNYIDIYDEKQLYFSFHHKHNSKYIQNNFNKPCIFYNKYKNELLTVPIGHVYACNQIRFYGNECYPEDSKVYQTAITKNIQTELKENFQIPDKILNQIKIIYRIDNIKIKEVYGETITNKFFKLKLDTKNITEIEELPYDLFEREFIFST
ncbi:hypothetical protein crov020 [Cafeteria roenbergensis virus]|uniref:Uncharacterized protein n=1 Tax=Cafeteria roenbergensis virus (strain BV-PW1) TaxID=693272 RepID=E3T4E0_CROVB|nr:hypothetical protein crov020 [Cafeteria roenbergensis virus BV-PW1]ADO67053.1 hypothetical protein crov020 [Cafeteria roenbergensis virus BV-PW1]